MAEDVTKLKKNIEAIKKVILGGAKKPPTPAPPVKKP